MLSKDLTWRHSRCYMLCVSTVEKPVYLQLYFTVHCWLPIKLSRWPVYKPCRHCTLLLLWTHSILHASPFTWSTIRQKNFTHIKFSLYLWLDSYHKNIISKIIIATLCRMHVHQPLASVCENFNPQLILLQWCIQNYFRLWKSPDLRYLYQPLCIIFAICDWAVCLHGVPWYS